MKHLDLFSGIGGFALACKLASIETICFVEIDKYCQKVLRKHWSDVPIVEDIKDIEKIKEIVTNATGLRLQGWWQRENRVCKEGNRQIEISCADALRPNGDSSISPTLLITAGFPCQPFSVAGKQRSAEDDHYLWPETLAVIEAIKPKWVLLENVAGIINLVLDTVLSDLEGAGYATETLIIPACAVNAWHRRDRIWVIAYLQSEGLEKRQEHKFLGQCTTIERDSLITNTRSNTLALNRESEENQTEYTNRTGISPNDNRELWAVEPELGRVAHGIPNRVDRLKCLGNAIVPQVAYEVLKIIKEIDSTL